MIRLLFYLGTMVFIMFSCSSTTSHIDLTYIEGIDKDFQDYVEVIREISNDKLGYKINSINYFDEKMSSESGYTTIGISIFSFVKFERYIKINREFWRYSSIDERIILLAHEIRHSECIGSSGKHIEGYMEDNCPKHYMNPIMPSLKCINEYYVMYINQIKRGCK